MLGIELDLQTHVKNLRGPSPKNWGAKTAYFGTFQLDETTQDAENRIKDFTHPP